MGRDSQGWRASGISAGAVQDPAAGRAPTGLPAAPLPLRAARPSPSVRTGRRRPRSLRTPRAPRLPTPWDVDPVPRPPFSFSRISRGLGYLLAPMLGRAPPPRAVGPALTTTMLLHSPKGRNGRTLRLYRDKTPDPNSWNPSVGPNFPAQLRPEPLLHPRGKKGLLPSPASSPEFSAPGPQSLQFRLRLPGDSALPASVSRQSSRLPPALPSKKARPAPPTRAEARGSIHRCSRVWGGATTV